MDFEIVASTLKEEIVGLTKGGIGKLWNNADTCVSLFLLYISPQIKEINLRYEKVLKMVNDEKFNNENNYYPRTFAKVGGL